MLYDKELDVRGLTCPLPILRTKKTLADLPAGAVLRVLATDPGSVQDFPLFARQTGNVLIYESTKDGVFIFHLRRRADADDDDSREAMP